MSRVRIYIIMYSLLLLGLAGCEQGDTVQPGTRYGVLELDLQRDGQPRVATRSIDDDLALTILDAQGNTVFQYAAGAVPQKILFENEGQYTLKAYTENQETWKSDRSGKGSGCYYADTVVTITYDVQLRATLRVPMKNYAVTLALPDYFTDLFSSYTFMLSDGQRTVSVAEGEKAYFDVADGGFSYALTATNIDGRTSRHSAIRYSEVEIGKLYTVHYDYDSDATTGGVSIEITDNMEIHDDDIPF